MPYIIRQWQNILQEQIKSIHGFAKVGKRLFDKPNEAN